MDDSIEVIRLADRELLIMADCLDYGRYSRPETHGLLSEELKKARERGVVVRSLVYDQTRTQETNLSHFTESEFAHTCKTPQFLHYFACWSGITPTNPAVGFTHSEFLTILQDQQEHFTKEL